MADPVVKRTDHGAVTVLTLNRPERKNCLSHNLMANLRDAMDEIALEDDVRAVILTGSDPFFCGGMDLREVGSLRECADSEHISVALMQEFADLLQRIHTLPKPVIAALNGDAISSGAGLFAACDLAVAAENARIAYPEVLRGLVPAISTHDLTRIVGSRRARQLLLTGQPIGAAEALEWGLVNSVTSHDRCLAEAIRLGRAFVACAPLATASIKRMLDEAEARPSSLRGSAAISAAVRVAEEAREGIRAFLDKRPPKWAVQD